MKQITEEDVFKNEKYTKYSNIFNIILWANTNNKKPQFKHLKYALCKTHSINFNDFDKIRKLNDFFVLYNKDFIDIKTGEEIDATTFLDKMYESSNKTDIDKELLKRMKKVSKETYLDQMKKKGHLNDKYKFSTESRLSEGIGRLINLNLIEQKKRKGKHPNYVISKYGLFYQRLFYLNHKVKDKIPYENKKLSNTILQEINTAMNDTTNQISQIMKKNGIVMMFDKQLEEIEKMKKDLL